MHDEAMHVCLAGARDAAPDPATSVTQATSTNFPIRFVSTWLGEQTSTLVYRDLLPSRLCA